MVKRYVLICGLILMIGLVTSCVSTADAGRDIFNTGGSAGVPCTTCHSLDGSKLVGPSLKGIAARAGSTVAGLSAEEYIRQSILDPQAYVSPGFGEVAPMPTIFRDHFTEDEINKIIAYLMTLN